LLSPRRGLEELPDDAVASFYSESLKDNISRISASIAVKSPKVNLRNLSLSLKKNELGEKKLGEKHDRTFSTVINN